MVDVINALFGLIGYLAVCIILGGFGFGSVVWLLAIFLDIGWSYMGVVRVCAVIYFILNTLLLLAEN